MLLNPKAYTDFMKRPNASLKERMKEFIDALNKAIFGIDKSPPADYLPAVGRLVKLHEAAGKIRVIAIVDPITNWVLKPLHDWVFAILRQIPQDGTFDQEAPLRLLHSNKKQFIGSCDMSAATDRLPVKLQEQILAHIFGKKLA